MSNETREHLSCLMDGEISRDTGRFLIRRLSTDNELRATWARYHLMRDCLRDHEGGFASQDFSSRVNRALAEEHAPRPRMAVSRRWLKSATGIAAAASVALAAIVAVDPGQRETGSQGSGLAESPALESFSSPQSLMRGPASRQVSLSGGTPDGDNRMNSYLLRHYQASGKADGRGFVSFVPIIITPVATESRQQTAEPEQDAVTERDGNFEQQ